jgi:MgtC family
MTNIRARRCAVTLAVVWLLSGPLMTRSSAFGAEQAQPGVAEALQEPTSPPMSNSWDEVKVASIRLPLAALLGSALALRPRRRGTPPRTPAVLQTQIILAIVGAVIMLVVGASLARAFGIVGAANLIRYRSKIDDPKDAVVMLCALSVGLAAGVGLYGLSVFGTLFLFAALFVIEGFQPQSRVFELVVKLGERTPQLRPRVEAVLRRFKTDYELRGQSEEEVSYMVTAPLEMQTDRVSNAITALVATGKGAVEWKEQSASKSKKS